MKEATLRRGVGPLPSKFNSWKSSSHGDEHTREQDSEAVAALRGRPSFNDEHFLSQVGPVAQQHVKPEADVDRRHVLYVEPRSTSIELLVFSQNRKGSFHPCPEHSIGPQPLRHGVDMAGD